jgi:probable HAF family extracellular repeat protein
MTQIPNTFGGAVAASINNEGQVAGEAFAGNNQSVAFLYSNGVMTNLGNLGGPIDGVYDVNDAGQVVGYSSTTTGANELPAYAFLWSNGTLTNLGTISGTYSQANGINDSGQIVGEAQVGIDSHNSGIYRAFLWNDGAFANLGTLGGASGTGFISAARSINDHGEIVGYSNVSSYVTHGFLYVNGTMTDLGTLGGTNSSGNDINDSGEIVGSSNTAAGGGNQVTDPVLWNNGTMTDLGTLGGTAGWAQSINSAGVVVGNSDLAGNKVSDPFIYINGKMTDLTTLMPSIPPGLTHIYASQINDRGQILIWGYNDQYQYSSYVLTPDNPAVSFALAVSPASAISGTAGTFTATALDANGWPAIGYTGTVHFTSSDANAKLPADYTFTSTDAGAHTFGDTLFTAGIQTITATDTVNSSITGTDSGTLVDPAYFVVKGFRSPTTAGVAHPITVTAKNANGTTATGYRGTVDFTSTDSQATLPAIYAFTASDDGVHAFPVTLKTAGSQTITVTDTTTAAITGTTAALMVTPAATAKLVVTGFPSPSTAGVAGNFIVTAEDKYGNTTPGYSGTVTFSSTDSRASLPQNYTFTSADKGLHTFNATLVKAGSQSLIGKDTVTSTIHGTQSGITVVAAALDHLVLKSVATITAGIGLGLTVTAVDLFGNTVPTYTGTVEFTSSDKKAVLPANYTFASSDNGSHTFTKVVLKTAGMQTITVTDTVATLVKGTDNVTVNPNKATRFIVSAPSSVTQGVSFTVTVKALDAYGNIATGYLGTVNFTSSDQSAVLPANYQFQSTDAGVHHFTVTFNTTGTQSLTVTDTANSTITGSDKTIHVTSAPRPDEQTASAADRWANDGQTAIHSATRVPLTTKYPQDSPLRFAAKRTRRRGWQAP